MCKCTNQVHIDILFCLREHYVSVCDRFALLGQLIMCCLTEQLECCAYFKE